MGSFVHWRGLGADYTTGERQIMQALPVKEQAFVHALKAFTDGEICEAKLLGPGSPATTSGTDGARSESIPASQAFTNPEDIPFGKPKRRPKTYAVVWSWRKHKIHKTKKRCEERLRVWKRWYERQGWTVSRLASGYMAELAGTRHSIQLHEYDRETRERFA